jgi:hypothetical protein
MRKPEFEGISLIPYIEGALKPVSPTNVSEFVELLSQPVKDIGRALHTEFSGLNLRGIKTHNVSVYRGQPNNFSSIVGGITLEPNTIVVVSELTPSEVTEAAGPALQLFLNQLQLKPEDITKGAIMLKQTHEYIAESSCPYDIALLVSEDAFQKGENGIIFKSYGSVQLLPEAIRLVGEKEYRSDLYEKNDKLFTAMSILSNEFIPNPLIARGIIEAARLVGKGVVARKIEATLFK